MKDKRLNDELTIIALILTLLVIMYYLISSTIRESKLETRLIEAQTFAIKLDKRLTITEEKLDLNKEQVSELKSQLDEYKELDTIIKDIATSWDRK